MRSRTRTTLTRHAGGSGDRGQGPVGGACDRGQRKIPARGDHGPNVVHRLCPARRGRHRPGVGGPTTCATPPPGDTPGTRACPRRHRGGSRAATSCADRVGSGAMGSVWRAWDHQQGRWVGAKVLGEHDAGLLLRFVREQSVRVDHPHVVAPTGWAAEDHLVVLTMDLVRGGSLDDLLREHGPLPESYVAVLLAQLLRALAAVHEAGVVHRDVKPANLLLEPTGSGRPHLRLGDFGVATPVDEPRLTRHPGVVGTDGYLAPEQADGAPPDPRQDLYAAGVVVRELLTARTPRQQAGRPAPAGPPLRAGHGADQPGPGGPPALGARRARAAAPPRGARGHPVGPGAPTSARARPSRHPARAPRPRRGSGRGPVAPDRRRGAVPARLRRAVPGGPGAAAVSPARAPLSDGAAAPARPPGGRGRPPAAASPYPAGRRPAPR